MEEVEEDDFQSSSFWTKEEDKAFENALAINFNNSNLWEKITAVVPGRTLEEIKLHFAVLSADVAAIESGLVPLPCYADSFKESRNLVGHAAVNVKGKQSAEKQNESENQNESSCKEISLRSGRNCESAKKPWSLEEHRSFLEGLKKYGKGDWRSISRFCVQSRTPVQVASHAQKFFKRLNQEKHGKRSSIFDLTTLDDGSIVTQQVPTSGMVAGVAGSCLMDNGLYPSANTVGDDDPFSSLDDMLTLPGLCSQEIIEPASVNLCIPMIAAQRLPTPEKMISSPDVIFYDSLHTEQHDMFNSQGAMARQVIGTVERMQVLDLEESSLPVHPDIGILAPTASQPTQEPIPSDVGIWESFPSPSSSMFLSDSPDYAAFFCSSPGDMATLMPPSDRN